MRTCFDNDGRDDMQTAQHHPTEIYASVTDAENEFVRKLIFSHPIHTMQKYLLPLAKITANVTERSRNG